MSIEYIASGTSYLRLISPRNREGDNLEYLKKTLSEVEKQTNHKFGMLYNAFVEAGFGEMMSEYRDVVNSIHSDSGGLQIVTQGKSMTPELKTEIYNNQGKYSDMAMSFDEIPVGTLSGRSGRNDTLNRWFDSEKFEYLARETGKNVKEQIETFNKMGSDTKPIFIAQGNCLSTYQKWTEYALSEIPKELHSQIGGVAMGAAALGTGMLEDMQRAIFFSHLPIKTDHLHILGVGAKRRLIPYIAMKMNGNYDGINLSYDSTTHTSGVEFGQYYMGGTTVTFNRNMSKEYIDIMNDVSKTFDWSDFTIDDYFAVMNNGYTRYTEEKGQDPKKFLRIKTEFILSSIINFCREIDRIQESKKILMETSSDMGISGPVYSLFSVKTEEDYERWMADVGRQIKSNKIQSLKPSTLEGFGVDYEAPKDVDLKAKPKKQPSSHSLDSFFGDS